MTELREAFSGKPLGEKEFDKLPEIGDVVTCQNGDFKVHFVVHVEIGRCKIVPIVYLKNPLVNDWPEI